MFETKTKQNESVRLRSLKCNLQANIGTSTNTTQREENEELGPMSNSKSTAIKYKQNNAIRVSLFLNDLLFGLSITQ